VTGAVYPTNGHPGMGFNDEWQLSNPSYYGLVIPDGYTMDSNCSNPNKPEIDCTKLFTYNPNCTKGMQGHGFVPTPLGDDTYPALVSTSVNVPGSVTTNPPNWTCGLANSLFAVDQSGSGNTHWFIHEYENSDNTGEPFQGYDNIMACAPDGKWCALNTDMFCPKTGNGFSGNTGLGQQSNGQCYVGLFSVTLN
jgi:hypothetical protein